MSANRHKYVKGLSLRHAISEVERITGMTFFPTLPKNIADSVKSQANIKDWD